MKHAMKIGKLTIDANGPFFVIAGPCVIEDEATTFEVARFLRETGEALDIPIIFKTSFDKANRTSLNSFRGPGVDKGMDIIQEVKLMTGLPVLSDVHQAAEIEKAPGVLDVIQIPAFLCRQTDLILAAARTGLVINLKKGQFLSPWDMGSAVEKVISTGNQGILITERGTSFGYNNLVVDIRSIPVLKSFGFPVVFDATHSVQLPGGHGTCSGGQREFVAPLARAAVAAGADGVFMEVHPDPDSALCDGPNSLRLHELRPLLTVLKQLHSLIRLRTVMDLSG
ncbi:MAG: 3-deoxy-8-phosphooctulonate synthase [Thermodesulfobacteriota bacterium]|nr:3-deoxy-8-phosphooctulonate synthase [Thermodesulfobacteriota bacterium]